MSENVNEHASVVYARVGDKAFVKPLKPCTAVLCERIKQTLDSNQFHALTHLSFDLSETHYIDSTFAGFLVSLAKDVTNSAPSLHLIRPSVEVSASLGTLHLLDLFDIQDHSDGEPPIWETGPDGTVDSERLGRLVVDAHERLIDADERNAAVFRPVINGLKAEIEARRTRRGTTEPPE